MRNKFGKVLSALLIFAILFSTLSVAASAEEARCQIDVECLGCGEISDGGSFTDAIHQQYPSGTTVTLTARAEEDNEFLYWENIETHRIVSFDASYTFYAVTYAKYNAVFDESQQVLADRGEHRVVYLSSGDNIMYSDICEIGDDTYPMPEDNLEIPGKRWDGWEYSQKQVAEMEGRVYVHPVYTNYVYYNIRWTLNGTSDETQVLADTTQTITAPSTLNGKAFSYWVARAKSQYDQDVIVSYSAKYSFIVAHDVDIEAVYGEPVTGGVACSMAGDLPDFTKASITLYADHSVTNDYEVMQYGLLLTKDVAVGNDESRFYIDSPDSSKIIKGTSKSTARTATYRVSVGNWVATTTVEGESVNYYPLLFARAYVIVKDAKGNVQTIYSPIHCADYVNTKFIGILEGDNYDDPFG